MTPASSTAWTAWPARDGGETRFGFSQMRAAAGGTAHAGLLRRLLMRSVIPAALIYSMFAERHVHGWADALTAAGGIVLCGALIVAFGRVSRLRELALSLGCVILLLAAAGVAQWQGYDVATGALCFGTSVVVMQRLPLAAAVPLTAVALGGYTVANDETWVAAAVTVLGVGLGGYVLRLDAESRHRLKLQERAAHAAEAESAALGERARIARDIHDVLAHSLSAQLVHLEAARLRIEQEEPGPFRDQILERVVAARAMARDGLSETRQALSALRGEMAPLGDYLREVAASDGAEIEVTGTPRPVRAEASQTVRRVVQEALTNVRKHAPGARVRIGLTYAPDELVLSVRDSGGRGAVPAELASSGSGYGLLGMRERAELLGGTLDAGPDEDEGKGYSVRLRVPA
ncbi:sensor histidine kinase [Streptomyces fuscigenes]|uniref:sensor histidine kinase n=1 Tax=Streptomyces fuscigenes TaxID=1528880 RepID=UPI001F20747B|nr:histidine kinase [Streptomyces fuscigenes]MCF3962368.1 histidine kinase [Streptomyces fuscigenes]